ncbi:FERM and PDZ domain-containing protein 1-like isoform X2 [Paramormyrops kingsleyae]|uniref:FERM and PDZ domain-containing protein 1-like isoform X2 n=1 Tax=Paramormyrops kingsleyae TaxID=1676925 RepID=UPI003B96DBE8
MEEKERSLSPSRRASRVEQVVGRWLRRSRDSNSRERAAGEGKFGTPVGAVAAPIKLTVKLARDPRLDSHGFEISDQCPLLVTEVTAGGPADGRLVQGDQVLTINNIVTDDLSAEQAAEIIRESWDCVTLMVLRHTAGPKSSFMTAEKRARLRSNPVKVHFAEEVVVNGHTQGNSLLFLPNVLKVYLENGQTKAFKFEAKTTVKEIVLTLKEKLSIRSIEYFGLVLEEQYSVNKQLLLHQEEYIQQVVHKKEVHDYRCLFRVCFVPRDPLELLQEDPVAFEYLYLQSVNDVLQERFAVEMKCNTALHLAALHIHERLDSCGQTHRTSLKSITKEWGIENFISPTLLRNMSEKDLKKAIGYHLKKIRALLDPKQKVISATQARLSYLAQLGELQSYGGKCFTATILFQDRESMVNLLVGARYGISQVINQRLNIIVVLTEFTSITRVDLLPESERVSLVKIYLQDVKQITLLMESAAAKDFSCLVTGYCKLHLDPALTVFSWSSPAKMYRIPTEAGYPQDGGDLDDFSIVDSSGNVLVDFHFSIDDARVMPLREEEDGMKGNKNEEEEEVEANGSKVADEAAGDRGNEEEDETLNLCHSRSQSLENLDDDDLLTCSAGEPSSIDASHPYLLDTSILEMELDGDGIIHGLENTEQKNEAFLCFRDFSSMADSLPSPPEATDEEDERQRINLGHFSEGGLTKGDDDVERPTSSALTLDVGDLPEHPEPAQARLQVMPQDLRPAPVLQPSPSFVDSSSEDEFFDANDKFVPSAAGQETSVIRKDRAGMTRTLNLHNLSCTEQEREENERDQMSTPPATSSVVKKLRKRHFFAENYTSQVSFPVTERENQMVDEDQLGRSQETLNTLGSCTDKTTSERHMDESQVATEVTEVTEASTADVEEPSELTEEVIEMPTEESEDDPKLLKVVTENRSDTDTFCHRLCSDVERSESKMLQLCKHPDVGMCNIGSAILSREDESEDVGDHMTEVLQEPKELYRDLKPCESKQPQPLPHPYTKGMVEFMPPPVLLVSRTPQEHCGCQSYSNCFSRQTDRRNLDEEEMPDQTQGREGTCLTVPSMYPASSIPPFSRVVLPCSSSSELSPLLSPLDPADCSPPDSLQEVLNQLRGRHYRVPGGFSLLQQDLLELLTILEAEPQGRGQHHWETCVAHLSENKHLLHAEARKLMSNCQRVIRVGQGPDEMLRTLSESFHTLVQLASMCLCFSSCCQCEGSLTKVLGSLREITKAYREFSQEAELACGRKSCQDVSIKVLARQCTALTASVFCLTQLYCTLAAL